MSEIPDLLRELIEEIQGLRSDLSDLRGPLGYILSDIHDQLRDTAQEVTTVVGGPLGYTLQDVVDRLGTPSIYGLEDVFNQLGALTTAVEDLK